MENYDSFISDSARISILGGGRTGLEVAKYLHQLKKNIFLSDCSEISQKAKQTLTSLEIPYEEGGHSDRVIDSDLLVVSPGVPLDLPVVSKAHEKNIPVLSEIELAFRLSSSKNIIAVSGTNGKTTTVRLIHNILRHLGVDVISCGNIGNPFIGELEKINEETVLVLEVSSYQLEGIQSFKPRVAVLLNISPDHIKRHGTLSEYKRAKFRLFENQTESDKAVINQKLELLEGAKIRSDIVRFGEQTIQGFPYCDHNRSNLSAALAAVKAWIDEERELNVPVSVIRDAIEVEHRMEHLGAYKGVEFFNDSKATNPAASAAAIDSLEGPLWVLIGGRRKKSSGAYSDLLQKFSGEKVRGLSLFGECRKEIRRMARFCRDDETRIYESERLKSAVIKVFKKAERGDVILLSPACSSFDAYKNYKKRTADKNNVFRNIE